MHLTLYVQLIFLCVVNIIFTFSGIFLNTFVIVSIWKSSQLRKKLCHFMVMVLSCFDLVAVATNSLGTLVFLISWLKEDYDLLTTCWLYLDSVVVFFAFSLFALLVMSIERYLAAYYPIFHRTSVTRHRLLTLLAILLSFQTPLKVISIHDMIIPRTVHPLFIMIAVFLPLVFLNYKLFKISREVHRRISTSPEKRARINLKSISTCLLVVACLVVLSIPNCIYIIFNMNTENKEASNARLSFIWTITFVTMNCTFNSLIFFWKNTVLRTEGMKLLKTMKDRLVRS